MAFLEGLSYGSKEALGETRGGMPIYNGTAHGLAEWTFKVRNRCRAPEATTDPEQKAVKLAALTSQVIEGLTDEALKVAMDMTDVELSSPNAIQTLIARTRGAVCRKSSLYYNGR